MSGSGREAIPDVRMLSGGHPESPGDPTDIPEWSGGYLGCPRVVGRPSRMSGSGREILTNIRKWSRVPPRYPGVVGRPS